MPPTRIPITEKAFQHQLVELAILFGWMVYHQRPAWIRDGRMITALQGHAGFPDLVLVRAPRLIIAELKSDKGEPTVAQLHWLEQFRACPGVETYLWRPTDLMAIQGLLSRHLDRS